MAEPLTARQTEIDGIPTFWTPGESDGVIGGLLFRVGWADEPYAQSGITHLVEHLALNAIGQTPYGWNGAVDHVVTTLAAKGTADEVSDFLSTATRALGEVQADRLPNETRVLRTEAQERRRGPVDQLLVERYGVVGYGRRPTTDEWFLWQTDVAAIEAWTARYFTRENAALWFYGEPPAHLSLTLPRGERRPTPAPTQLTGVPLPHWQLGGGHGAGVAVGVTFDRASAAGTFMLPLIAERLQYQLRLGPGIVRQVTPAYLALDPRTAHGSLAASCLDEDAPTVARAFVDMLQRVAQDGLTDEEFALGRERHRRGATDEQMRPGLAPTAAVRYVTGAIDYSRAELDAEINSLTNVEVASAMSRALSEAIMLVPPTAAEPVTTFLPPPGFHDQQMTGVTYTLPAQGPRPWSDRGNALPWRRRPDPPPTAPPPWPRLVMAPDGLSFAASADEVMAIIFADVVGYFTGEEGARTIVRRDGYSLRLVMKTWAQAEELELSLDRAMDPSVTLKVSFQNPAATPARTPAPASATSDRTEATTLRRYRPGALAILLVAAVVSATVIATALSSSTPPIRPPVASLAPLADWPRQTSPDGAFSILLPGKPRDLGTLAPASSAHIPIVVLDWTSQDPPVELMVAESPVGAASLSDPTGTLIHARAVRVGAGTLVDSTNTFVRGYPAVDFSYGINDHLDFVREVLANGHLYELVALGYPAVDPRTAEAFFDTIEFRTP